MLQVFVAAKRSFAYPVDLLNDILFNPKNFKKTVKTVEKEIEHIQNNSYFNELQGMNHNLERLADTMEKLNENIVIFAKSIEKIAIHTQSISNLEEKMSIRGLISATFKDIFLILKDMFRIILLQKREVREKLEVTTKLPEK